MTRDPERPFVVSATIEVPTGTSNKYEMAEGNLVLSRVLYSPVKYPADYGYIDDTLFDDGDPLDILVVISEPAVPGCRVPARVVGGLHMTDEKGLDTKILAVCDVDPRYNHIEHYRDLGQHFLDAMAHFFEVYKTLEGKPVTVGDWFGRDEAMRLVLASRERRQAAAARA